MVTRSIHKKNGKGDYMKVVHVKDCWSFQTKVMNILKRSR